jgi:hypothetical protein
MIHIAVHKYLWKNISLLLKLFVCMRTLSSMLEATSPHAPSLRNVKLTVQKYLPKKSKTDYIVYFLPVSTGDVISPPGNSSASAHYSHKSELWQLSFQAVTYFFMHSASCMSNGQAWHELTASVACEYSKCLVILKRGECFSRSVNFVSSNIRV